MGGFCQVGGREWGIAGASPNLALKVPIFFKFPKAVLHILFGNELFWLMQAMESFHFCIHIHMLTGTQFIHKNRQFKSFKT